MPKTMIKLLLYNSSSSVQDIILYMKRSETPLLGEVRAVSSNCFLTQLSKT